MILPPVLCMPWCRYAQAAPLLECQGCPPTKTTFPSNPFAVPPATGEKRVRGVSLRLVLGPPLRTRCISRSRQVPLLPLQSSLRYFSPAERVQVCLSSGLCHDPAGALHILPGGTRLGWEARKQSFL